MPAGRGGVRDYAEGLALEWSARGIESELLAFDEATAESRGLAARLSRLAPQDQPLHVLLHFSGYGYARRALCFWLLHEVQAARLRLGAQLRLVTMVHELFVSGAPWQPAFWLGRLQAHVVRRVTLLSDAIVTNSQHHGAWLSARVRAGVPVRVAPVFSNVGEAPDVPPPAGRDTALVVFGSASTRQRALALLARHGAELRALRIERVVEAGPGPSCGWSAAGLASSHLGELTPAEIESLLQSHRYGLIDYPSFHLGKSGVFAAYAANGCIVLNTAADAIDADGLRSGRDYVSLRPGAGSALTSRATEAMSKRLRTWYLAHRRGRQATEFLADLRG